MSEKGGLLVDCKHKNAKRDLSALIFLLGLFLLALLFEFHRF